MKALCWRKKFDYIFRIILLKIMLSILIINSRKLTMVKKYFLTLKGIEIGQILGVSPPLSLPQKFRKHCLNRRWLFVSVQKETPRRNFTLYPDFANLGSSINSQLNRPFWFDSVIYLTDELEYKFCHTLDTLKTLK